MDCIMQFFFFFMLFASSYYDTVFLRYKEKKEQT